MIECPVSRSARLWPDRTAVIAGDREWSYREFDAQVGRAANFLRAEGAGPEARIAAVAENCPELVVLVHAAARLGAPLALLHPRLAPVELEGQLARIQPHLLFAVPGLPSARDLSSVSTGAPAALPAELDPQRIQSILFTSGSSGVAKAVALTVGNHRASALASGKNLGDDPDQRWLACLPLCHVGGLAIAIRAATYGASLNVMVYETSAVAGALAGGGITHVSLVPTMLRRLIEARAFGGSASGLRAILVGGAPSDPPLWEQAQALGLPVLRTYGLTETASQVTAEHPGEFSGTCGRPLAGVEVRIVDAERGGLPSGTTGEIEVSGPNVMAGYHGDPGATRSALPDRWLRTHDLGSLDALGRLSILARRADLILSGGENIAPAEVASVLCAHPQVREAVVLAVPHPDLGQVPLAVLVARGERPTEESLRAWCHARLAPFKCPRRWVFVGALPRNAVGKVDLAALRDAVERQLPSAAPAPIALPGDPDRAPQIRRMFDRIAPTYDRLNHLLTFNIDRRWRRRAVAALSLPKRPRVLDLCAGTLDLTVELVRAHPQGFTVATDFSFPMLSSGAGKAGSRVGTVCADALALPFASGSFDAVLCAFGVRNLASLSLGMDEIARVLRPGGQLAVLEFFRPESVWSRGLQELYNRWVLPCVGGALSGDPSAYRYLAGSIAAFASVQEFQELLTARGFSAPRSTALFPGVASLVTATRA